MATYKGVDIFKLFFAICVVAIHIECFISEQYPPLVDWMLKLAVPFFFTATGYLLHLGGKNKVSVSDYLFSKAKHVAVLFIVWITIYLPIDFFEFIRLDRFNINGIMRYLDHLLFYGEGYYSWPMWYLYSLSIGLLMMALVNRFRYGLTLLFISLILILYSPEVISLASNQTEQSAMIDKILQHRCLWGGYLYSPDGGYIPYVDMWG